MNDEPLEARFRMDLRRATPRELPAGMMERAASIPLTRPAKAGRGSTWAAEGRSALGVLGVVAAVIVAIGVAGWRATGGAVSGPANPVGVSSSFGALTASDFVLSIDGERIAIPNPSDPEVLTASFQGSATFGQLTLTWTTAGRPFALLLHFSADAVGWWVSDMEASDGRAEQSGWIDFAGPLFATAHGTSYAGEATVQSVRSSHGVRASMSFGHLGLAAFNSIAHRQPTAGPIEGGGSSPDFVSIVSGATTVGYVSAYWHDNLPIVSFRGLAPDQPVFGPDLKTIVGFSLPGGDFAPLN